MPGQPAPPLDERVLESLRAGGPMTPAEIGRALGVDRMPVGKALNRLRARGLVRLAGHSHQPRVWGTVGVPGVWEAVPSE